MKRFQSIRWNLQWWYGMLLAVTITTLAISFYFYERNLRDAQVNTELTSSVSFLVPRLIPPGAAGPGPNGPRAGDQSRPLNPSTLAQPFPSDNDPANEGDTENFGETVGLPDPSETNEGGEQNELPRERPRLGPRFQDGPNTGGMRPPPRDGRLPPRGRMGMGPQGQGQGPRGQFGPPNGQQRRPQANGDQNGEEGEWDLYGPPQQGDNPEARGPGQPGAGTNSSSGQQRPMQRPGQMRGAPGMAAGGNRLTLEEGDLNPIIYWCAYSRDGSVLRQSENLPEPIEAPGNTDAKTLIRDRNGYREAYHQTPTGTAIVVGISHEDIHASLRPLKLALGTGSSILFLCIMIPAWWLTGRSLKPISQISETAGNIIEGDYSGRIETGNVRNELGELADVLNESFSRLDDARKQQLRFTADASHELRTPLSVIIADGELALRRDRDPERYQKTINMSVSSALHMRDVIENLIEISRLDTKDEEIKLDPIDLDAVGQYCADMLDPLARKKDIEIQTSMQAAPCMGNTQKLKQVAINLIGNAIHHAPESGWVRVETFLDPEANKAILRVSDSGSGIPEEDLPYVFNRFYRSDKSRTDSHRSGLGLTITRSIVEAHNGRIRVESPPGEGAIFTVELPIDS